MLPIISYLKGMEEALTHHKDLNKTYSSRFHVERETCDSQEGGCQVLAHWKY